MDPELAQFRVLDVDRAIMPLLIVAENARNPGLNLVPLHMDMAEDEEVRTQPPMGGGRDISLTSLRRPGLDGTARLSTTVLTREPQIFARTPLAQA